MSKRKNSRGKGGRGERELAAFLTEIGYPAERAARNGVEGGEDIICKTLEAKGFLVEGKRVEALRLGTGSFAKLFVKARQQHPDLIPLLFWRYNRGEWNMTVEYEHGGTFTATGRESIREAVSAIIKKKGGA